MHLLLVENFELTMQQTQRILSRAKGVQVDCARTAEEALDLMKNTQFDLIITDIELGEDCMSGVDFIAHCKSQNLTVVAMSADEVHSTDAMHAGAFAFVCKRHGIVRKLVELIDSFRAT